MLPAKVSEHLIFWRFPCPVATRELKCVTLERTALYSLAPVICFHYDLFSQEITPLHGTIFYRESVYVLWIYSYYIYIYCHYKGTIRWSVLLTSFCPLPRVGVSAWLSDALRLLYVTRIPDTRNSSHLKQTALCPQRKCLTRKLF